MKFTKMHGAGNNYIYFDCFKENITDDMMPEIARCVADKNFGIGADGAIFICPSDAADAEMKMFNADGSYSKMCGNGIRCVAKYMYDNCIVDNTDITVISGGSIKYITLTVEKEIPGSGAAGINSRRGSFGYNTNKKYSKRNDGMCVTKARIDMGEAYFAPKEIPVNVDESAMVSVKLPSGEGARAVCMYPVTVEGTEYKMTFISVSNPHAVIFMDDVAGLNLEKMGPAFENHELFPEKINTEFVRIIDRNNVEMRVYERGSGETLACGTGGTAVSAACFLNGFTDNKLTVHMLGGDVEYEWDEKTNRIFMTGPAEYICEGEL